MRSAPFARLALSSLSVVLLACDEPVAPGGPFVLEFEVVESSSSINYYEGHPSIGCLLRIEARATGRGEARWTRAVARRFLGLDRSTPVDSFTFAVGEWQSFDPDTVKADQPDTLVFGLQGYDPFSIELEYYYRVKGEQEDRSHVMWLDCGPLLPEGTPPPTVTLLSVAGSDAVIESGDTVIVRYKFDGGGALWRSRIRISGPFATERLFHEEFVVAREREERFVVPRRSKPGMPITVELLVEDAASREVVSTQETAAMVVDVTPPQIIYAQIVPGSFRTLVPVSVEVQLSDENDHGWLVWELAGEVTKRDSVFIDDANGIIERHATIIAPDVWTGLAATLTIWARDAGGNYSLPMASPTNSYTFYATVPAPAISTALLPAPDDVAYDPVRNRLYFSHTDAAKISVIDVATLSLVSQFALGPLPGALDLSPSGDSLLVTQSADLDLAVVDLNTLGVLAPIALTASDSIAALEPGNPALPNGVRVASNGRVFVQQHRVSPNGHRTLEVDLASGLSAVRTDADQADVGVPIWWRRMAMSGDRTRMLLLDPGCPRLYDAATNTFSPCRHSVPDGLQANEISFSADGSRILVGATVLDADLTPLITLPFPGVLLPGGDYALVSHFDVGIAKVRVSDGRIMKRFITPYGVGRMTLLPDGATLVVLGGLSMRMNIAGF